MIQKGFIGDALRLKPICEGLDVIDIDDDNSEIEEINVVVHNLPTSLSDKYQSTKNVSGCPIGSAGNAVIDQSAEPQMGAVDSDVGDEQLTLTDSLGGIGKMNLSEAESGVTIDDTGIKNAKELHSDNAVDKVNAFFDKFAFKPRKQVKFDNDVTAPKVHVSDIPLNKIPRGW